MSGSTKILTVSYGTFSCTLEGFDDSFHSMKAIAEYFRDLAQDDRYFGAEPPAPDAEMLARIAEREISRRVEAQIDGKGIRLRATMPEPEQTAPAAEPAMAMPPKAEAPAPTHSPSSLMPAAPLMATAAEAQSYDDEDDMPVAAAPMTEPPAHPDAQSVAAKLQRIRAVVGKPAATVEDDSYEDSNDLNAAVNETITPEPEVEITAEDIINDDEAETVVADAPEKEVVAEAVEDTEVEVEAEVEAVVEDVFEVEETEDDITADTSDLDIVAETTPTETPQAEELVVVDEDLYADLNDIDEDVSSDLNDIDDVAVAPAEQSKAPVRARIVRLRKDKPAEVVAAPVAEEAPADTNDADMAQRVSAALKVEAPVADIIEPEVAEAPEEEIAVKVDHIAETLEADTAVVTEEIEDASPQDDIRAAVAAAIPAGSSLTVDDEDDLLRELAAVTEDVVTLEDEEPEIEEIVVEDAIVEDITIEDVAEAPMELPEVVEAPARAGRESLPVADDAAVSRILTQTDEALNEPTGSRRRNAIAQLKAAVAATEAARQLGDKADGEAEAQEAFREDLDQVVRPRRPASPDEQDLRSERPRAAPLKLVASQRVDEDDAASDADDLQPRRVASRQLDASETGGFAQFAAQMGAKELPDLLEAAAAYTSFVEGVEDFSRPQIMKKVQLTTSEEFSREDGLRSFGTLLRQGRISKVRNGRFQISEQTRFRPDARSA